MKPPPFVYHAPESVADVVRLLQENEDDDVRMLAGGQSLVPLMNFRLSQPGVVVDLRRVSSLAQITVDARGLLIGAMVRQATAEHAPEVANFAPIVVEALGYVAHPTVRHSGTVGGSVAHADPSAEMPAVTLALRAELVLEGPDGQRVVAADDFFDGPFTTVIRPDEILVGIRVPRRWHGQAFVEFTRTNGSFALAGVGTCVDVRDGRIVAASIGMSGVGATPIRATAAEVALVGSPISTETVAAAAEAAIADLAPAPDVHAGTASRVQIARTCAHRSIESALTRAAEGN